MQRAHVCRRNHLKMKRGEHAGLTRRSMYVEKQRCRYLIIISIAVFIFQAICGGMSVVGIVAAFSDDNAHENKVRSLGEGVMLGRDVD